MTLLSLLWFEPIERVNSLELKKKKIKMIKKWQKSSQNPKPKPKSNYFGLWFVVWISFLQAVRVLELGFSKKNAHLGLGFLVTLQKWRNKWLRTGLWLGFMVSVTNPAFVLLWRQKYEVSLLIIKFLLIMSFILFSFFDTKIMKFILTSYYLLLCVLFFFFNVFYAKSNTNRTVMCWVIFWYCFANDYILFPNEIINFN